MNSYEFHIQCTIYIHRGGRWKKIKWHRMESELCVCFRKVLSHLVLEWHIHMLMLMHCSNDGMENFSFGNIFSCIPITLCVNIISIIVNELHLSTIHTTNVISIEFKYIWILISRQRIFFFFFEGINIWKECNQIYSYYLFGILWQIFILSGEILEHLWLKLNSISIHSKNYQSSTLNRQTNFLVPTTYEFFFSVLIITDTYHGKK